MFTHNPAERSAITRGPAQYNSKLLHSAACLLLIGMLAGCTAAPSAPLVVADPSDPGAPTRAVRYSPVITGYTSQRPVGPKPWREQNERVAPR